MQSEIKLRWWQRHPFAGLAIGWAIIAFIGVDVVGFALLR